MRWKLLRATWSKHQLTVTIAAGPPVTFGTLTTLTALVRADQHFILPVKRRITTLAFGSHLKCHSTLPSALLKQKSVGSQVPRTKKRAGGTSDRPRVQGGSPNPRNRLSLHWVLIESKLSHARRATRPNGQGNRCPSDTPLQSIHQLLRP